jgi:hypothetical protein
MRLRAKGQRVRYLYDVGLPISACCCWRCRWLASMRSRSRVRRHVRAVGTTVGYGKDKNRTSLAPETRSEPWRYGQRSLEVRLLAEASLAAGYLQGRLGRSSL